MVIKRSVPALPPGPGVRREMGDGRRPPRPAAQNRDVPRARLKTKPYRHSSRRYARFSRCSKGLHWNALIQWAATTRFLSVFIRDYRGFFTALIASCRAAVVMALRMASRSPGN